jgi:hypothetical protein
MVPVFLAVSAVLWFPYGVFCFVRPDYLAGAAGVSASNATGVIELRAMYGGLQAAIGVLAGLAFACPTLRRAALVTLLCVYAGLGLSRLGATFAAAEVSAYTGFALVLELGSAALTGWCLVHLRR